MSAADQTYSDIEGKGEDLQVDAIEKDRVSFMSRDDDGVARTFTDLDRDNVKRLIRQLTDWLSA